MTKIVLSKKDKKIIAAWDLLEDDDISTERLFQMVEDATGYDAGYISEALYKQHQLKEQANDKADDL